MYIDVGQPIVVETLPNLNRNANTSNLNRNVKTGNLNRNANTVQQQQQQRPVSNYVGPTYVLSGTNKSNSNSSNGNTSHNFYNTSNSHINATVLSQN